jgi:hypothetical protein
MSLLIASITLPLTSSCLVLWKCGLIISLVGTHRGIVSHVGALDMSHLLLLLDLAHAILFFIQGAISYMVILLLALEASDESLLWLELHLGDHGGFAILPRHLHYELSLIKSEIGSLPIFVGHGTASLGCGTAAVCAG